MRYTACVIHITFGSANELLKLHRRSHPMTKLSQVQARLVSGGETPPPPPQTDGLPYSGGGKTAGLPYTGG